MSYFLIWKETLQTARFPNGVGEENINLFGGFAGQNIQVEEPSLMITALNGLGVPLEFEADPFTAQNEAGQSVTLDYEPFRTGIPLAFPTMAQQGQQIITDIALTTR